MKQTKAICIEVEGLLPLFVGGDLEQEDSTAVQQHIEECALCAVSLQAAEDARRELRRGLAELVDGREPQLWPAIREELAREGLFREAGSLAPIDTSLAPIDMSLAPIDTSLAPVSTMAMRRSPVPGGERERLPFTWRSARLAGGLAASLALIFLVGRSMNLGKTEVANPNTSVGSGIAYQAPAPGASPAASVPTDLFADAGSAEPAGRRASGLRPVGLGETPLFDQARDAILRERQASGGIFFLPTQPTPSASEGELASSFSLQ